MTETNTAPETHGCPARSEHKIVLDLNRVNCLKLDLEAAAHEWARAHGGTTSAEIGHACLLMMFDAGQESGLDAKITLALAPPQSKVADA